MQIFLFENGNIFIEKNGKQVPELQKPYIEMIIEYIETNNIDPTTVKIRTQWGMCFEPFKTSNGYNWRITSE